ncbi:MAG: hypothetical protein ACR2RE_28920 [Geminicoccaceae bacterium]
MTEPSRDNATLGVALQPAQVSPSVLADAPHRSSPSSSPDPDGKVMTSFDHVSDGL